MKTFRITHQDGTARVGKLRTPHGTIETPFFMPAATKGTGKFFTTDDYNNLGGKQKVKALIANSLLLSLEPGVNVIKAAGGLHQFMNFSGIIFTDCGGFQMSRNIFEKKTKQALHFRNPFNGAKIVLTPEKSMEIQLQLGHDVAMMLDDMSAYGVSEPEAREAMENTLCWGKASLEAHQALRRQYHSSQLLFGIVQGNFFSHLRVESAQAINSLDFDGIAIGGVAIGEPKEKMYQAVDAALPHITLQKPRYVMGVGSPEEILELIDRGIDCFDSVYPTQVARHSTILTRKGRMYIDSAKHLNDFTSLEEGCQCHTCRYYTKSYLCHLTRIEEPAVKRLKSIHNSYFMQQLISDAIKSIKNGHFQQFKQEILKEFKKIKP